MILAVGADTVYGALSRSKSSRKQGFDNGAASIARVLVRFTAVLVPVVFLTCGLTKGNWLEAFLFALSIAVGLTPELLPMVVNACLAWGSVQMGKKRVIVKNINAMQSFGSMDVLCVDKTGTLTEDTVRLEYYMDTLCDGCLEESGGRKGTLEYMEACPEELFSFLRTYQDEDFLDGFFGTFYERYEFAIERWRRS